MSLSSQLSVGDSVLRLQRVAVGYDRWPIIADISFEVRTGRVVGIIGDNAVGKTSLIRGLFADGAWIRGDVTWCGRPVPHLRTKASAHAVSWVRQDRPIFPTLTVADALRAAASAPWAAERHDRVERVVARIPHLKLLLSRRMEHLSGGERALASVGIGLLNEPRLICLDEPAANLSELAQVQLGRIIANYVAETGAACIVVEHRLGFLTTASASVVELCRPEDSARSRPDQTYTP